MALNVGVQEVTSNNTKYITLRTGRLCESAKEQKPGFSPAFTENKSGKRTDFFAKEYDNLVAFVDDMRWHVKEFDDGAVVSGWNLTLTVGDTKFVLNVTDKERPFNRLMSALANCDFSQPLRFVAFKGRDGNKVLLLSQEDGSDGKSVWVQGRLAEKWLNQSLIQKIRDKQQPNDEEKTHLAYDETGRMLGRMTLDDATGELSQTGYPYIVETVDGKWNTSVWTAYLRKKMEEDVIPAIRAAAARRQQEAVPPARARAATAGATASSDPYEDMEPDTSSLPDDDDSPIPF